MSNLIDSGYTQLNNLSQINADDIQTESINTKTLKFITIAQSHIHFLQSMKFITIHVNLLKLM